MGDWEENFDAPIVLPTIVPKTCDVIEEEDELVIEAKKVKKSTSSAAKKTEEIALASYKFNDERKKFEDSKKAAPVKTRNVIEKNRKQHDEIFGGIYSKQDRYDYLQDMEDEFM